MTAIICILLAAIVGALVAYASPMLDTLFSVVFNVAGNIGDASWNNIVSSLTQTLYSVAIWLMIIKCLVKIFNTYILWNDGEDVDPIQMIINFIKSVVIAFCFPYIYRYFVDIAQKIIDIMISSITGALSSGDSLEDFFSAITSSLGLGPLIIGLIFLVEIIVMYFSFLKRGIELEMMLIGVPLACTGLLDNDKGIFRSYMNQMIKIIVTTMFQIVIMKIGLMLGFSASLIDGSGKIFYAIGCMFLALKVPQILSEWMIPSGGNGGIMNKMYSFSMFGKAVKGLVK